MVHCQDLNDAPEDRQLEHQLDISTGSQMVLDENQAPLDLKGPQSILAHRLISA